MKVTMELSYFENLKKENEMMKKALSEPGMFTIETYYDFLREQIEIKTNDATLKGVCDYNHVLRSELTELKNRIKKMSFWQWLTRNM